MADSAKCINDVLPPEILQKILLFSAESFSGALEISTTCRLWRKLICHPFIIQRYWKFDEKHRKNGLLRWWNFNDNVNDQNNPFINLSTADCFLGKCVTLTPDQGNAEATSTNESLNIIDRGSDYTVALWYLFTEIVNDPLCLFMISDDDWDYARSTGVYLDENNYLSIVFSSSISQRVVKSNVQMRPNEWFHIVLVQERELDKETPRQKLWINGQLELTVEVPIAAFSNNAIVSFRLWVKRSRSIADVSLWSRRFLPIEIRAIYEQKTSIDKVDTAKYILEHLNN